MATTELTGAPERADHAGFALLPQIAAQTVANFDRSGSLEDFSTVTQVETLIAEERAVGTPIEEWEALDLDGQPLRIVRIAGIPDGICVFGAWPAASQAVA